MKKPPLQKPFQDDYIKSSLRLPRALHTELMAAADYNGRGLNAEIMDRLRAAPVAEMLKTLLRENAEMKAMLREIHDRSANK